MTNKFEVGSIDDAEAADYFVCMEATTPLMFPDNLISSCCKCGVAVQHRPKFPVTPRKVCWSCATPDMAKEAEAGELEVMVSPEAKQEIEDWLKKKNAN